ncbi:FAD-binding oxidoreductase [Ancylobacter sp. MQZ15Z-1]|uniref:FAD-binding oxidoreductase n=1 Tax=Ancylobacter mangrovi TaxID=2972472 RepID=A0A9X2T4R5_9HYPH|nr:FAD-binding oxidoreductase [Ancylobacter mangrovi]MCS0494634.1 FAD-binding oxidoreductase [Ancylobacter mangrovi]
MRTQSAAQVLDRPATAGPSAGAAAASGGAAYIRSMVAHELERAVGPAHVSDDPKVLQAQAADWSWFSQYLKYRDLPLPSADLAVSPASTAEVAEVVRIADHFRVPVIVRGGGSGTQGGTLAPYGGIALDLSRMNRILDIDEQSLILSVEAGMNGWELEQKLNERGLTLPHYPGSMHHGATAGGYVAARGSGVVSTKYGKAEDLVLQVKAVMPPGRIVETLPVRNHAAGPDLLQVLVGSEGTLGAITELKFQLERLPERRDFVTFRFDTAVAGIEAARQIMTKRWKPAVIRLYDPADAGKLGKVIGRDISGSVMVICCEGNAPVVEVEVDAVAAICTAAGGEDLGPELASVWWENKYQPFASGHAPAPPQIFGTTDSVTTFDKLPELYLAKKRAIEEGFAHLGARYTAHFSHWYPWGGMIYDRFYVDEAPDDPDEAVALHDRLWDAAIAVSLKYGGVINEHHGIGLKLGRFMRDQYGEAWHLITSLKDAWDPNNIMNPGKLGFGPPRWSGLR